MNKLTQLPTAVQGLAPQPQTIALVMTSTVTQTPTAANTQVPIAANATQTVAAHEQTQGNGGERHAGQGEEPHPQDQHQRPSLPEAGQPTSHVPLAGRKDFEVMQK